MTDFPPPRSRRHCRAIIHARLNRLALAVIIAASAGCASRERWTNPPDPLEPANRVMFGANMALDRHVAEPISNVYRGVTPEPVRYGVRNFFRNLSMPFVIINDLLQARFGWAGRDTLRFITNTTVGFGGIADPATTLGLEHRRQNFGVTAGVWGLGPGPYLVLPLIGPTSVAGLPDIPMRIILSPVGILGSGLERTATLGVGAVSEAESRRDSVRRVREAIEPYSFVKSGYMQKQWEIIQSIKRDGDDTVFDELPDDIFDDENDQPNTPESPPSPDPRP